MNGISGRWLLIFALAGCEGTLTSTSLVAADGAAGLDGGRGGQTETGPPDDLRPRFDGGSGRGDWGAGDVGAPKGDGAVRPADARPPLEAGADAGQPPADAGPGDAGHAEPDASDVEDARPPPIRDAAPPAPPGDELLRFQLVERAGVRRRGELVTTGVPLPVEADIRALSSLALARGDDAVPCTFRSTARWGGRPDDEARPVRWLLLDLQADLDPGARGSYRVLRSDDPPDAPVVRVVADDAAALVLDTGAGQIRVRKDALAVVETPEYTLDGVDIAFEGGQTVRSSGVAPSVVRLEEGEGLRRSVRIEGRVGELTLIVHLHVYARSTEIRAAVTLANARPPALDGTQQPRVNNIGSAGSVRFTDATLRIRPAEGRADRFGVAATGAAQTEGAVPVQLEQASQGGDAWDLYVRLGAAPRMQAVVPFRGFRLRRGGQDAGSGERAIGVARSTGPRGAVMATVRDLWKNFPKRLAVDAEGIAVGLFPANLGGVHSLRAAEQKTHHVWVRGEAPGGTLGTALAWATARGEPLRAELSAADWARSGVPQPLDARDPDAAPDYEESVRVQLDPAARHHPWQDHSSAIPLEIEARGFYGWMDYGDLPIDFEGSGYAPLNMKYNLGFAFLLQWMRTGDWRFFKLGEAGARHYADIDILHTGRPEPEHWADGGAYGHSAHDEIGFANPHRNEVNPHPDMAFGVAGMLLVWHLTGDREVFEAAGELARNQRWRFDNTFGGNGHGSALDFFNMRAMSNGLRALTEYARATGEVRYLDSADRIVAHAVGPEASFLNGPNGQHDQWVRSFQLFLLMHALAAHIDTLESFGRDAAQARTAIVRYARFADANLLYPEDGGRRSAYPYDWHGDGSMDAPEVNGWLLTAADGLAVAARVADDPALLDAARRAFRGGSEDPFFAGDLPVYTSIKESMNILAYGPLFLAIAGGP